MTKYKFLFFGVLTLLIASIVYPIFHNEKSREITSDVYITSEKQTRHIDSVLVKDTTIYHLFANDTSYICDPFVVKQLEVIEHKYYQSDYDIIALFNDDDIITKIYQSDNVEFVSFFRFNKNLTYFIDNNSGYWILFALAYFMSIIVFGVIFFIILDDSTDYDYYMKAFMIIVLLLMNVIYSYLYMYFENPLILVVIMFGQYFYAKMLFDEDVADDYQFQKKIVERLKNKKDNLKRNFNTLIK